jgi:hypothetical protein
MVKRRFGPSASGTVLWLESDRDVEAVSRDLADPGYDDVGCIVSRWCHNAPFVRM